jgi:hypothetical protein
MSHKYRGMYVADPILSHQIKNDDTITVKHFYSRKYKCKLKCVLRLEKNVVYYWDTSFCTCADIL